MSLNYTTISRDTSFNRDSVELFIKEVVLAVSRHLSTTGSVELNFCNIGQLTIHNSKIRMKFYRDFIQKLDLDDQLHNTFRPHTANSDLSIITNPQINTTSLPK